MDYPKRHDYENDATFQAALLEYWEQFPSHPDLDRYVVENNLGHTENPGLLGGKKYYRGEASIKLTDVDSWVEANNSVKLVEKQQKDSAWDSISTIAGLKAYLKEKGIV